MASKSKTQIWIEYAFAKTIMTVLGVVPRRIAIRLGLMIAGFGYNAFSELRRVGLRSLEIAFPEKAETERRRLLKASFMSLGRTLGVVAGFKSITRENIHDLVSTNFDPEFAAEFAKIRGEKRGFIILTGHLGNWELFALSYSMFFGPSNLLSRKMDNPKIDEMVENMRSSFGNRQIDKINAAGPILRILRDGQSIGILADVNTQQKEGIFVPFFGVEACTTAGVALLAQRANAAIVPLFAVWNEQEKKYSMINEKIIFPANTGDRDDDVRATTVEFTAAIERVIRRYPEQWVWIHRRWKTRPEGEPNLYD